MPTQTSTGLAARGAYARLALSFATGAKVAPVVPQKPGRLEHAARQAGGLLETIAIGAIFVLILAGPVLLLVALVGLALVPAGGAASARCSSGPDSRGPVSTDLAAPDVRRAGAGPMIVSRRSGPTRSTFETLVAPALLATRHPSTIPTETGP